MVGALGKRTCNGMVRAGENDSGMYGRACAGKSPRDSNTEAVDLVPLRWASVNSVSPDLPSLPCTEALRVPLPASVPG